MFCSQLDFPLGGLCQFSEKTKVLWLGGGPFLRLEIQKKEKTEPVTQIRDTMNTGVE